uniref:EF-hand domain-containing protein n=1 Tax=Macrostomum lignano TaxID=282301 RepID=A0A1I8FTH6_9PLAT
EFRVKWLLFGCPVPSLLAAATVVCGFPRNRKTVVSTPSTVFIDATSPRTFERQVALLGLVLFFNEGMAVRGAVPRGGEQLRGLIRFGLVHRRRSETAELLNLKHDGLVRSFSAKSMPFGPAASWKLADLLAGHRLSCDAMAGPGAVTAPATPCRVDSIVRASTERRTNFSGCSRRLASWRRSCPACTTSACWSGRRRASSWTGSAARLLQPGAGAPGAAAAAGAGADGLATVEISRLDESGIVREDKDGELTYAESLRFLVEYNRNFRAELLGENRADDSEMRLLSGLLRRERLAFGIVDLSARTAPTPGQQQQQQQDSMKSNNEEL